VYTFGSDIALLESRLLFHFCSTPVSTMDFDKPKANGSSLSKLELLVEANSKIVLCNLARIINRQRQQTRFDFGICPRGILRPL
jgi:hypothetical protein